MAEETISTQRIFEGEILNLRVDTVKLPDGRISQREIVEHEDAVAVVAQDEDGNILLVRQYRKPIEKELLEIPAGGIEPNEKPEDTVRRELREEIGYMPRKLKKLGGFYASPGYASEYLHLFLATDLVPDSLEAEDTAGISVIKTPIAEITKLIQNGDIEDAKSIAGLLMFLHTA